MRGEALAPFGYDQSGRIIKRGDRVRSYDASTGAVVLWEAGVDSVPPFVRRRPEPSGRLNRRADGPGGAPKRPAGAVPAKKPDRNGPPPRVEPFVPEQWSDEGAVRRVASAAAVRAATGATSGRETSPRLVRRSAPRLPDEVTGELAGAVGQRRVVKVAAALDAARASFERERYEEARRSLVRLAGEAPSAAAVRELLGLTLYRLDRWRAAATEFEAYRSITGSVDQNPVLADCYRALRRYGEVDALWDELRAASPSAELVAEGRIVAAGALADQGKLDDAIALLVKATSTKPKRVREHHLRQWYVLADLYDRAGDAPRARRLFQQIGAEDPSFADVEQRLGGLGSSW